MNRLAIVMVATAALTGCKKQVKSAEIEKFLTGRLAELGMPTTKVGCPANIEPKTGTTFECTVDVEGTSYTIVGTITAVENSQIKFDNAWKKGDAIIRSKLVPALSDELSKQFATKVTLACAEPLLFLDKARNVTCDLAAGKTNAKVVVTFDDKLTPTDWKLDPALLAKAKLEAMLTEPVRAKTSPGVAVTCGDEPLLPRPADGVVWCQVAEGDKTAKLKVDVAPDLQVKTWEVVAN